MIKRAPIPFSSLTRHHYRAILVDAPLGFKTYSAKGEGRSPQIHYACMPYDELAALPIAELAAPDCFIFSWIPLRSVFLTEPLMQAWGFKFSGSGFVWVKQNPKGPGWFMGGGYGTREERRDHLARPAGQSAAVIGRRP